jgi:hypothetical protein
MNTYNENAEKSRALAVFHDDIFKLISRPPYVLGNDKQMVIQNSGDLFEINNIKDLKEEEMNIWHDFKQMLTDIINIYEGFSNNSINSNSQEAKDFQQRYDAFLTKINNRQREFLETAIGSFIAFIKTKLSVFVFDEISKLNFNDDDNKNFFNKTMTILKNMKKTLN